MADGLSSDSLSRSRRQIIADRIRQDIVTAELRPGQSVTLKDIADRFGTSVTPVRDALLSLADEGLVEIQTRKGIQVLGLSKSDIQDLFEIHAIVSGIFAERAVSILDEQTSSELQMLVDEMDRQSDQSEIEKLNWRFHSIINHQYPSVFLRAIARTLARTIPRKYFSVIPGRQATAQADHVRLLQAFRDCDSEEARRIAEYHIRTAGKMVVEYLSEIGYWDRSDGSRSSV